LLGDRFRLVTQNVDGLHIRAGNSPPRTYQIHGNIDYARCAEACDRHVWRLPEELGLDKKRGQTLTADEGGRLRCPRCNGWARPQVLWFDEYYDEEYYRFDSSIRAAASADILVVLGTSGATNLPLQMGQHAASAGALIVDINLEANPFSRLAQASGGIFLQGECGEVLPGILSWMHPP
jgi:NAD-dependent deacetylase